MAIEEELESCGSRVVESLSQVNPRQHRHKFEVYNEVLRRIQDLNYDEANLPGFDDHLWLHFNRLPARYSALLYFSFTPFLFFGLFLFLISTDHFIFNYSFTIIVILQLLLLLLLL